MTKYERKLARKGAYLMLTHGIGYSTDDGQSVPRKAAQLLLFADDCLQPKMLPNEDGLFPGFSQTWSPAS